MTASLTHYCYCLWANINMYLHNMSCMYALVYMVSGACARPDLVVLLECFVVCVCVCVVSQC